MKPDRTCMRITKSVIRQIEESIGSLPPECGGVLGISEDGVISEYYFDQTGESYSDGYVPDVVNINRILAEDWMPQNVYMAGIIHSHCREMPVPSCGDVGYGMQILQALDTVDAFYLPILTTDGESSVIHPYAVFFDEESRFVCRRIRLDIMDN